MQKRKISNFIITMMSLNLLAGISYADENSLESLNTSDKKVYSDYNIDSNVPSRAASGLKTFYVKGAAYQNQTGAFLSSGRAFGFTKVYAPELVPQGYLGAHANLYNHKTGRVVATADWAFNTSRTTIFTVETSKVSTSGNYYTKGTTIVYNGSGYTVTGANQSPVVTVKSLGISLPKEELDERQRFYEENNMIAAEGIDGTFGYVSLDDLYDEKNQPQSPEEVARYMSKKNSRSFRMIPLYDADGKTVIGKYRID